VEAYDVIPWFGVLGYGERGCRTAWRELVFRFGSWGLSTITAQLSVAPPRPLAQSFVCLFEHPLAYVPLLQPAPMICGVAS